MKLLMIDNYDSFTYNIVQYFGNVGRRPQELAVTAWTDDGEIMAVRHTGLAHLVRMEGVQFHPESILTEHGHAMLKNFLN